MMNKKILFIVGTRPELIKIFPIVHELRQIGYEDFKIASTGQHLDLLEPYWKIFDIVPDFSVEIMKAGQSLSELAAAALKDIQGLIENMLDERPDIIVAQGDTTTVMCSAMVSFFNGIKFAHVEAGLRSFDLYNPFPEEYNRKVASLTTTFHFSPTNGSTENLLKEGVKSDSIHTVGNTVVDTLSYFLRKGSIDNIKFRNRQLYKLPISKKNLVLITCHRRENHENIHELIKAITSLACSNQKLVFVWPVHPNPNVKNAVLNSDLVNSTNVILTEPLDYLDLLKVLSNSYRAITDSGGIQEEAPSFKLPILVLREVTERPEGIKLGLAKLTKFESQSIIDDFNDFNPPGNVFDSNPYGDGKSSKRIIEVLMNS